MKQFILFAIILFLNISCELLDECGGTDDTVWIKPNKINIDNPIILSKGEAYQYDLINFAYLVDREGSRNECPKKNKRLPNANDINITISTPRLASASIIKNSLLEIRALNSGSTNIEVSMSFQDWDLNVSTQILKTSVIIE